MGLRNGTAEVNIYTFSAFCLCNFSQVLRVCVRACFSTCISASSFPASVCNECAALRGCFPAETCRVFSCTFLRFVHTVGGDGLECTRVRTCVCVCMRERVQVCGQVEYKSCSNGTNSWVLSASCLLLATPPGY